MIRVKWLKEVRPLEEEYALYADVPLGPNGELDLRILKRKWGLENCLVSLELPSCHHDRLWFNFLLGPGSYSQRDL